MTKLLEGKTKVIQRLLTNNLCIIISKNTITANDDPSLTKEFETKAIAANNTTCNVFQLLANKGIPVAFKERLSDNSFLADYCKMIPLEVVARRYAVGSYLKRVPEFAVNEGEKPYKFDDLCIEFFLKTTEGKCIFDGKELIAGLLVEDPYIDSIHSTNWRLLEPKLPYSDDKSYIADFDPSSIIDFNININHNTNLSIERFVEITKNVFEILEEAWKNELCDLIDFKIEFGITMDGRLVVSDVIDNDSWRLECNNEDYSKQSFRDGESLTDVERKYLRVMEISNNFVK